MPSSSDLDPGVVVARLNALERTVLTLRAALVVAGAVAVALVTLGAKPPPPVLEASSLILRDDNGNARAKLYVAQGSPRLAFADSEGRTRVLLALEKGTPMLSLSNEKGVVQAQLSLEAFGPAVYLRDAAGSVRSAQTVVGDSDGNQHGARLDFFDAEQRVVLNLRAAGGEVALGVGEEGGRNAAVLSSRPTGARLHVTDRDGKTVFQAP